MTALRPRLTLSLLLLVGGSLLASGCVPLGTQTRRDDRRYPDPRRTTRGEAVIYTRISQDANRYVRSLDRTLRLNRRQEQRISQLLADRAYDQVRRTRARERAYPFPRRAADRATEKWWRSADKRIARELNRQQKRVYKDIARDYERSARRDDRRQGRHDNGRRRRGGGN